MFIHPFSVVSCLPIQLHLNKAKFCHLGFLFKEIMGFSFVTLLITSSCMILILSNQITDARLVWIPHMKGPNKNVISERSDQKVGTDKAY